MGSDTISVPGRIRSLFERLLDLGAVAWLCIYPLACALAALVLFTLVPQGRELLRLLVERAGDTRGSCAVVLYYVSAASLALGVWFASRVLLTRRFGAPARLDVDSPFMRALRVHVPWILAAIVLAPTAAISRIAGESWIYSGIGSAVAIAVIAFAIAKGRTLPSEFKPGKGKGAARIAAGAKLDQLPRFTKIVIGAWGLATFLLFVAFALSPVTLPRWFGSATIVLFALLGWTIFGSFVLVLLPKAYEWPSLAVLAPALFAIASSWTNDNHWPREAAETVAKADAERELRLPVAAYFDRWIRSRSTSGGTYPVFVVAAEGGGLRAAYWTASVLGRLQDRWPADAGRFSDHVFAISGVSGGGLGAAVFTALVAEAERGFDVAAPRDGCSGVGYAELSRCILNDDFLSPVLAALLFSKMCQQFFPYPVHWADRARALEEAWEVSWRSIVGSDAFGAQFEELWRAPGAPRFATNYRVPALAVNGTVVEDGRRVVFSNLDITDDFIEAYEGVEPTAFISAAGKDPVRTTARIPPLPLSTFVHMGARFTYVSPAARLKRGEDDDCPRCLWGRVVDGGYHENSGAATAFDILQAVIPLLPGYRDELGLAIEPYVILITNDPTEHPVVPAITGNDNGETALTKPAGSSLLPEIVAPIATLFSARESRSPYARNVLARLARRANAAADGSPPAHPHAFEFFLERRTSDPALGWVLSGRADLSMDLALGTDHNQNEVNAVVARAKPR